MKFIFLLFITLIQCSCALFSVKNPGEQFDQTKILGFEQFKVYTSRNLLGYVPAEGNQQIFDKKIWRGKIKEDTIKQTIVLTYSINNLAEINPQLNEFVGFGASKEDLQEVKLTLINPVQVNLEEISIEPGFAKKTEFFTKPYIASVLKADKIKIEFVNKSGITIGAQASLKQMDLKLGSKLKYEESENALYFAENAFVGYKSLSPPSNLEAYLPKEEKRLRLVIFPFEIEGFESDQDKWKYGLAESSSYSFTHNSNFIVIARNEYQKVLEEQKLSSGENFNPETAISIGKLMSANTIARGKIQKEGNEVRISLNLIDIETGAVLPKTAVKYDTDFKTKSLTRISDEWEDFLYQSFHPEKSTSLNQVKIGTENDEAWKYFIQGKEKFISMDAQSIQSSIQFFEKAIEMDSKFEEAYSYLADASIRSYYLDEYYLGTRIGFKSSKEKIAQSIKKALELKLDSYSANFSASLYYDFMEFDSEKAIYHAQKALEKKPNDPEARLRLFRSERSQNWLSTEPDHPELMSIYEMNPNLYLSNMLLGEVSRNTKLWTKAIAYYKKAGRISQKNIDPILNIAVTYLMQSDFENALVWIQKAEKLKPNSLPILLLTAQYHFLKKESNKSLEILSKAETLFPNSPRPSELKGNILSTLGEKNRALQAFTKSANLEPNNAKYWKSLGNMNFDLEKFANAIEGYSRALTLNPGDISLHNLLGDSFLELKNFIESKKNYEIAINQGQIEEKIEAYKGMGELTRREKNYPDSVKYYNQALSLNPNDMDTLLELSITEFKSDQVDSAIQTIRKVLDYDSEHPRGNYEYSKYLYKKGDIKKYKEHLQKSCSLGYSNACKTIKSTLK